jgi:hypothetical protein
MAEFDFEKNTSVEIDTFEEVVPGKYRGLYERTTNDEGAEVYTVSGIAKGIVGDYVGTSKSLGQARGDKKTASDESASRRKIIQAFEEMASSLGLDEHDDGVVSAVSAHISDLVGKVKGGDELRVNLDKIKLDYQRKTDEAIAAKDADIKDRDKALQKHLISDVATREITSAKGKVTVLMPHVERQCKVVRDEHGDYVVRVVDSQGDFRSDGAGGWMKVGGLVEEIKQDPDFGGNFESDIQKGGSGREPGERKVSPMQRTEGGDKTSNQKIADGLNRLVAQGGKRAGIGT